MVSRAACTVPSTEMQTCVAGAVSLKFGTLLGVSPTGGRRSYANGEIDRRHTHRRLCSPRQSKRPPANTVSFKQQLSAPPSLSPSFPVDDLPVVRAVSQ